MNVYTHVLAIVHYLVSERLVPQDTVLISCWILRFLAKVGLRVTGLNARLRYLRVLRIDRFILFHIRCLVCYCINIGHQKLLIGHILNNFVAISFP